MPGTRRVLRNRSGNKPRQRTILLFEQLEDRRLLAGNAAYFDMPTPAAEGESSCNPIAQIEQIRISESTPKSIDILFRGDMTIEPLISSGMIVDAVQVRDFQTGLISLSSSQFSFNAQLKTLSLTLPDIAVSDYVQLEIDGAQLQSCGGQQLEGGAGGLLFELPTIASADPVSSEGDPIEVGSYSVPSLADWNDDGLLDLVVGEKTDTGMGKIRVYLNEGTESSPAFASPFYAQSAGGDLSVPASGCLGAFPRVTDWDGDGLQDLIVGLPDGSVQAFLNTNSAQEPEFGAAESVLVGEAGSKVPLQVGMRATPIIVDWNEDGRLDLVVGAYDGKIRLYLNQSDSGTPDLGSEQLVQSNGSILTDLDHRSSPAVADLDGDGRKDLLLGNTAGEIVLYRNTGTNSEPDFGDANPVSAGGSPIDLEGDPRSRPFIGDFNNDSLPDLLVGSQDGLVRLYQAHSWDTPELHPGDSEAAGEQYTFAFTTTACPWHNSTLPSDATGDGNVNAHDVDTLFAELNSPKYHNRSGSFHTTPPLPFYCDVNDDTLFTPRDILIVIRELFGTSGEGEAEGDYDFEAVPYPHFDSSDSYRIEYSEPSLPSDRPADTQLPHSWHSASNESMTSADHSRDMCDYPEPESIETAITATAQMIDEEPSLWAGF